MNGSKMNIKRTVSMLLVVLMLVTAMPVTVLAASFNYELKNPTVTLESDDSNGGLVYTIMDNNTYGVASFTLKVYAKNDTDRATALYTKTDIATQSSKITGNIPLGSASSSSNKVIADNEYYITVEIVPMDGYKLASGEAQFAKTSSAYAVNKISSITVTPPTKMEYNDGTLINLTGMKVAVDYKSVTDVTYTYDSTKGFVDGNGKAPREGDLVVMIDGEVVEHNKTVLTVDEHHGKALTVKFRTFTKDTSTKLTVNGSLVAPTIKATTNYIKGGIDYVIEDSNASGTVGSYVIRFRDSKGNSVATTTVSSSAKTGTLSSVSGVTSGEKYTIDAYATAKSGTANVPSNWSESVNNVLFSQTLSGISISNLPSKMIYETGETFNASGLKVKFEYAKTQETKEVPFSEFEDYGITVTPANGTVLTKAYNDTVITVKVNGKTASSDKDTGTLTVTGALSKPSISLVPDYANGGLKYTITCTDHKSIKYYEIQIGSYTYTRENLTGNIPISSTRGDLVVGQYYSATVTAVDENGVRSTESDLSNSAMAVSPATAFAIYTKPNDLTYKIGDTLDYSGLSAKITFGSKTEYVFFEEFEEYGITVTPANGTKVTSTTKTVTVKLGNFTDTFEVTVGESNVASLKILSKPDKVSYNAGDKLDLTGLIIKITYTDGTNNTVEYDWADFITSGITTSPSNGTALKTTDEEVVVTCGGKSASFDITVKSSNKAVTKIEITKNPDKLVYDVDDKLDLEGLEITVTLKSGTKITGVEYDDFDDYGIEVDPTTKEKLAKTDTTVRVYYSSSVYDEFNITVGDAEIKSLTIRSLPDKTSYVAGEAPDYTGLVVRAYFDSAKKVYTDVAYADFGKYNIKVVPDSDSVTKYQLTVEDTSVLVYYGTLNQNDYSKNIYATFDITVKARTILSMEIYKQPTLVYQSGDKLDLSELAIKVYYSATNKKDFDIVTYESFEAFGIKCTPDNATVLTAEYNGTKVKATAGTVYVETNALTVTSKAVKNITVTSLPTKLEYNAGEKLSLEGLKLELTYADGTKKSNITYDLFDNYGITSGYKNGMALSASHNGKYMKFTVKNSDGTEKSVTLSSALKVVERAITELKVLSYTDTYAAGDSFDTESLKILARYENGTTGYVATESVIVDPRASLAVTDTKVTLYYSNFTIELDVYVYDLDVYNVIKDWDGSKYTDVKKGQWFYPYMGYMSAIGAIDPVDDAGTKLGPDVYVTRAMFVEMLYRIEGSPKVNVTGKFVDIPRNASYIKAAEWAYSVGITTGTSETAFSPDKTVTREQMVTFLYRYAEYKGCEMKSTSSVKTYPDYANITGYNNGKDSYGFAKSFEWAISEGIITGALNGGVITLNPLGTAMRSEASKILTIFHIKYIAE